MRVTSGQRIVPPATGPALTKSVLHAAHKLNVTARVLGTILGLSGSSISRMKRGGFLLETGTKPFELGVLFVRFFRALSAVTGGDEVAARSWLNNRNALLGARPLEMICTIIGLVEVIAYLDSRPTVPTPDSAAKPLLRRGISYGYSPLRTRSKSKGF